MKLITDQPEIVAQFVATGIGRTIHPPYTALGWVLERGARWTLVGGAVFNDYNGPNIEVTVHWNGPLTRQPMREMCQYVFEHCGCIRLTASTKRNNRRMRRILPRLGFEYEALLHEYFGPGRPNDAIVYRMTRAGAEKWLKHE